MPEPPPLHKRRPFLIALVVVAVIVIFGIGGVLTIGVPGSSTAAVTSPPALGSTGTSPTSPSPSVVAPPTTTPAVPTASLPEATATIPLVPIVAYWSTLRSVTRSDLADLVGGMHAAGPSPTATAIAVTSGDLPALAAALDVAPKGVQALSAAEVRARVKAAPGTIGIVRADDVTMDVRALAVDGTALFGAERIHDLKSWPLLASETGTTSSFSTQAAWTVAAGGDVMLDKAIYAQSVLKGKGADYAWNGGTAVIDSRSCCGWGNKPLANGRQTGNSGAVATLFRDADLGIVNLESPEPDNFTYHSTGFSFTGDPALLSGLRDAGIDVAGLANNHLGNGGTQGVTDTIRHLDALGIAHPGAGANATAARKAAWLEAGGLKVAILAYVDVQPTSYWATASQPGSAGYDIGSIVTDIKAAKSAGADMVFVMPHWGQEYADTVWDFQRTDARTMIAAGADLVLGSHSHWVGPFEQIDGDHLAFYSLGDLVFDWTHDERTQEGVVADLTFVGKRLVQVDLHPTFIIAGQPNLLDPAGDGQAVLGPVQKSSEPRLGW
jgi:poly-gamma-glutamate capsule biosynthesis protein CapA/YwtB (metallophosphatase superfamily)